MMSRVRKSENFPGSKIFHAKTFRIKRVNRDIIDFATNVHKTCQYYVFLGNAHKIGKKKKQKMYRNDITHGFWYPDSHWIFLDNFWIVSGLSKKFLDYPDSLWIVQTVSKVSRQSLDYPDSL